MEGKCLGIANSIVIDFYSKEGGVYDSMCSNWKEFDRCGFLNTCEVHTKVRKTKVYSMGYGVVEDCGAKRLEAKLSKAL